MKKVNITSNEENHYIKYSGVPKFKSAQEEFEWAETQTKCCNKCKEEKPLTCFGFSTSGRFPFNKNGIRYRRGDCLDCRTKLNNGKRRAEEIAERAGMSIKPTENDKCEFCGSHEKLVFDHDHKKETFRGWLCDPCNRAYGTLESRLGPNWKDIIEQYENK
jgi:hypothetical protein